MFHLEGRRGGEGKFDLTRRIAGLAHALGGAAHKTPAGPPAT